VGVVLAVYHRRVFALTEADEGAEWSLPFKTLSSARFPAGPRDPRDRGMGWDGREGAENTKRGRVSEDFSRRRERARTITLCNNPLADVVVVVFVGGPRGDDARAARARVMYVPSSSSSGGACAWATGEENQFAASAIFSARGRRNCRLNSCFSRMTLLSTKVKVKPFSPSADRSSTSIRLPRKSADGPIEDRKRWRAVSQSGYQGVLPRRLLRGRRHDLSEREREKERAQRRRDGIWPENGI